jgi:hypothetical protein
VCEVFAFATTYPVTATNTALFFHVLSANSFSDFARASKFSPAFDSSRAFYA